VDTLKKKGKSNYKIIELLYLTAIRPDKETYLVGGHIYIHLIKSNI